MYTYTEDIVCIYIKRRALRSMYIHKKESTPETVA